jgi:hypothetical protein
MDYINSRHTSSLGDDLEVTVYTDLRAVSDQHCRYMYANRIWNEWATIFLLKTLTRNRTSRCCCLKWRDEIFNLTNMFSYLLSHMPLKNLLQHKVENLLWILSCLDEPTNIMELQTTCLLKYGPHKFTKQNQKTVNSGERKIMYWIKLNNFKAWEKWSQCDCRNRVYSPTELWVLWYTGNMIQDHYKICN